MTEPDDIAGKCELDDLAAPVLPAEVMAQRTALNAIKLPAFVAGLEQNLAAAKRPHGARPAATCAILARTRATRTGWGCCQHQRILTFLSTTLGLSLPQSSQN